MDIAKMREEGTKLVSDFFRISLPVYDLSWELNSQIDLDDPFDRVLIRDDTIVLREGPKPDNVWYIDYLRGIIADEISNFVSKSWHRWNLATLVALLIIPQTDISESKKTQYRKQWIADSNKIDRTNRPYDYQRWYSILSSYNRKSVFSLLQEFVSELPQGRNPEIALIHFMHEYLGSYFKSDDLVVLTNALQYQTINASDLQEIINEFSRSKIYRILNRLAFHLDKYYLPHTTNFGLTRMCIISNAPQLINKFKYNIWYENTEKFKNSDDFLIKVWIPISKIDRLLTALPNDINKEIYLNIPSTKVIHTSPMMYQPEQDIWKSVYEHSEQIIDIHEDPPKENVIPKKEELLVLKDIVRTGSLNHRKVSLEYSQSETRRIIKRIEEKELFQEKVLWRHPSDLNTISLFLPQCDWEDQSDIDLDNLFTNQKIEDSRTQDLISLSWPYLSYDQVIKIDTNHQRVQKGILCRIAGRSDDLLTVVSDLSDELIGVHLRTPGTHVVIPHEQYKDNTWEFSIGDLIEILKE